VLGKGGRKREKRGVRGEKNDVATDWFRAYVRCRRGRGKRRKDGVR